MTANAPNLKHVGIISGLRSSSLFAGVPPSDLVAIAEFTTVKTLPKGAYLFHEAEPSSGFYIVQTGAINVHRVNSSGKEQVIHVFRAGESFAEGTLATDKGYPADARAVEPSQVLLVQKTGILSLLRNHPELALRMLGSMSAHLRILVGQLEDLTLKDVETRLANWLTKRCRDCKTSAPVTITLPMTKRVLAAELGTVSETLSRTLAKFREQDLISVQDKSIVVLSPPRLAELLERNIGG